MILGFEESVKGIKRALSVTGGDLDVFKKWNKTFDLVRKQFETSYTNYHSAKDSMEDIMSMLVDLEHLLADTRDWSRDTLKMVEKTVKEMKKHQGKQYHVLLVGNDHTDYTTTYESIMNLGASFDGNNRNRIMLQSEVENLIAIIKEAKEHQNPNTNHLAYLEAKGQLSILNEISYDEKLRKMEEIYREEFYNPIYGLLVEEIAKADRMTEEGITGFGAGRREEALQILVSRKDLPADERAKLLLKEIY